ncbi:filamentous hemagglutinin [Pseudomonas kilonensis]
MHGVKGLPSNANQSKPQKYLIETNPVLTDLKRFMSSDYLLENLGYDADQSAKRLGDGLYEQRLIQQAVVARTGQRFLDGQTTDEAMFKSLMNNALASKQALNLSLGVSLTSEQVAALTHDIVWMETVEVNGEQVLVPVLYLANANNRLAANGALIQGKDVTLIAGKDLNNAGTLRASNNLSVTAANDLVNSGLVEAGNRLDLLAGNNLVNKAGGIIAGRDVSLTTTQGDVVNERTVTNYDDKNGNWSWSMGFADSAARIEAGNNLSIDAGRDFNTVGSVVSSGNDLTIEAGRDVNIVSAQKADRITDHGDHDDSVIKQLASQVTAGRDLDVTVGRDLTAIASELEAKRDLGMSAVGDMTLASAADEVHSYNKGSSVTRKEDHVSQVATTVKAGGDVVLGAGNDMALIASRISAGDEAYLVAQKNLQLLAAQNSNYTLYDMEKKGGWGSKKIQRDEVTDVKNIGSEISTGGDLTLVSGGDQRYQVAKLKSGNDLTLQSGGSITFEGVKDLSQESHTKSDTSLTWNSMKGKGHTDEVLRQTQLAAQGELVIQAVDGLHIDIKQINQKTVSQTIDAMVKADPQLAWLKEAEQRGDVDWRLIKETHESFKYSSSSLGQGAMLAIIIVVTVLTAGAGTAGVGALGATAGASAQSAALAAGLSEATAATIAAAASAATSAAVSGAISQAAISVVNNKGDLGAVFKDVTSAESMKGYLINGLAAGFAAGVLDKAYGVSSADASKATHGFDLGKLDGFTKFASYTLAQNSFNTVAGTAINGGSLKDNLAQMAISSAADVLSAGIYNKLGTQLEYSGLPAKVGAHALVGGLIAELAGGDFRTGALAAGANEAFVSLVGDKIFAGNSHDQLLAMTSQLIGLTVAAAAGGSDKDQAVAAWVAQQATKFNYLEHGERKLFVKNMSGCGTDDACTKKRWEEGKYNEDSLANIAYAEEIAGSMRAQETRDRVMDSVDSILAMPCQNDTCEVYKAILVNRSLKVVEYLTEVIGDWGPTLDRLALMGGAAAGASGIRSNVRAVESRLKNAYELVNNGGKGIPSIDRGTEIMELFSSSSPRSGLQIGNRSLIEVPNPGNAKIFSGATDTEIKQYFSELTGSPSLPAPRRIPGKGDIYVVNTPGGNFTLRNFASSTGQTGPAWTIDIPKAVTGTTYNPEIKFLTGGK